MPDLNISTEETTQRVRIYNPGFILFIILLLTSAYAAYDGLHAIILGSSGEMPLLTHIFVVWFAGILAFLMWYTLDKLFYPRSPMSRGFIFLVYGLLLLTNVSLGFGFFWNLLVSRVEAYEQMQSEIPLTITLANRIYTGLETAGSRLTSLKAVVHAKADQESKTNGGGTCGDRVAGGEGPKANLHRHDADAIGLNINNLSADSAEILKRKEDIYKKFNAFKDKIFLPSERNIEVRAVSELQTDINVDIETINTRVNSLKNGNTIKYLSDRAKSAKDGVFYCIEYGGCGTKASKVAPKTKTSPKSSHKSEAEAPLSADTATFRCTEDYLQAELSSVATTLTAVPNINKIHVNLTTAGSARQEAFNRLSNTLSGIPENGILIVKQGFAYLQDRVIAKSNTNENNQGQRSPSLGPATKQNSGGLIQIDAWPLAIAVIVDVGLLFLSTELPRKPNQVTGQLPRILAGSDQAVARAITLLTAMVSATELNTRYVIKRRGNYYICVPRHSIEGGQTNQNATMRTAMVSLDGLGLFKEVAFTFLMGIAGTMRARGVDVPDKAGFYVWRATRNVVPEIMRQLIVAEAYGDTGSVLETASPKTEPQGARVRPISIVNPGKRSPAPDVPTPNKDKKIDPPVARDTSGEHQKGAARGSERKDAPTNRRDEGGDEGPE